MHAKMTGNVVSGTWQSGDLTWINRGREACHRHTAGVKYDSPVLFVL